METISYSQIEDFFSQKRIALIGLSRNPGDFSRKLSGDLMKRNYDLIPVNPFTSEIDGRACYSSVAAINPPVQAALIMTTTLPIQNIIMECVEAGIKHIWVYNGKDTKWNPEDTGDREKLKGVNLITGHCPYMFMENSGFFHKFHGFVLKMTGAYPK